jgi:protein-disulfide isomerase
MRRETAALLVVLAAATAAPVATRAFDTPAPLPSPSPSARVRVSLGTGAKLGSPRAPVVMVEFTDHQCPFCRRHFQSVFPRLKSEYIDAGKVRYVVRDLPLDIHAEAFRAAEAARCAGAQGKFWPMRTALVGRRDLSAAIYASLADQVGLDAAAFQQCLAGRRFDTAIRADIAAAHAAGIDQTPSFVIGRPSGSTVVGTKVVGSLRFDEMKKTIDDLLRPR